ncbi:hypothetical protein AAVH_24438 [Aphelenchoides avenae]|nr:hypothetical protein AAVH_24438 [Aphelenchus avenae]
MLRVRLFQLLLCLGLWTRLCDGSTAKNCVCSDVDKLQGLHPDRPCNECATGYYLPCTDGAYYAHHPTMCIYATRQEDFTHDAADDWCINHGLHGSSFLAFVGSLEESYDISHFVWNSLKNGVEGNETYFWLGGKYKYLGRTKQTLWLFEYRGYYDIVPRELLPDGLHPDRPCNECATGYYLPCTDGAYYAHHPTMCIYATRQEDFTHDAADDWCINHGLHGSSFLAFVGSLEESYDISHFVWNSLKNGVEGNETYFWLGGKYKYLGRTKQTLWLFEYRGYYDIVPRELLPDDAELEKAISEGRTCLAGHTENYTKLYPMSCDVKLPAVCYSYRQTAKHFCEQKAGKVWTLFQGKCYYVYSSPTKTKDYADYKTFFDAQRECGAMDAIVATVTDEATFKRTLDLATGLEKIVDIDDATWIGLQLSGKGYGGIYYYADGTKRNFDEHFPGAWEDGTPYDAGALKHFWAIDTERRSNNQPNEIEVGEGSDALDECDDPKIKPSDRHLCWRDKRQHCTQIFPGGTKEMVSATCNDCGYFSNKWNDRWCYFRQRGYICQRDAVSEEDPYRLNDEL